MTPSTSASPVIETPTVETPTVESPTVERSAVETPTVESPTTRRAQPDGAAQPGRSDPRSSRDASGRRDPPARRHLVRPPDANRTNPPGPGPAGPPSGRSRPGGRSAAAPARPSRPGRGSVVPARSRPSAARARAAARAMGIEPVPGTDGSAVPTAEPARSDPLGPEEPRHLRAVPPRSATRTQRRNRTRVLALAAAGLVLAVTFGLVYLHVVLAQRQFALDRLTAKVQAEQANYQNLRLQVAQSGSPAQIISTAEGQLGMRQPASVTYLTPSVTIGGAPDPAGGQAASDSVHAPAGDADWPQIKAQLAGSP